MKKYKEWLTNEIEIMESETSENYPHEQMVEREVVLNLINQLDEPEVKQIKELDSYNDELIRDNNQLRNALDSQKVLSQGENINIVLDDLKEYIKEQQSLSQNVGLAHTSAGNDTHYRQYDYVLECINEYEPSDDLQNLLAPKQELPVIPKHVAEWIEEAKDRKLTLYGAIVECPREVDYWLVDGDCSNQETFARAWLDGYEVEEEPKYYALIKGHELLKGKGDWVVPMYWCFDTTNGNMFISDRITVRDKFLIEASKSEWNKLGINDSNADFVRVEEMK